jgi:hypothetical protein
MALLFLFFYNFICRWSKTKRRQRSTGGSLPAAAASPSGGLTAAAGSPQFLLQPLFADCFNSKLCN